MKGLGFAFALALAPLGVHAAELTIQPPGGAAKVLTQADLAGLPRESVQLGAQH